ncbi:MAG TPA: hypothetical protein VIL35_08665 [Vicinamibacterales bacterium]
MAISSRVKVSSGRGVLRTADGSRQWPVAYTATASKTKVLQGSEWVAGTPDLRAVVTIDPGIAAELVASGTPLELELQNGERIACVMTDPDGTLMPRRAHAAGASG